MVRGYRYHVAMNVIHWDTDAPEITLCGGKAWRLAQARALNIPIPLWFVLSGNAFEDSLIPENRNRLQAPATVTEVLQNLHLAPEVENQLRSAIEQLCPHGEFVAVRSSAIDEDQSGHSFAGQYESYLNVPPDCVADRVIEVWRSGFSPRISEYRRQHGLTATLSPPAVLIQRMLIPETSGVAFGADPATGETGVAVISATRGLNVGLTSGTSEGETWKISAHEEPVRISESGSNPATTPSVMQTSDLRRVAETVWQLGDHFGTPQDIEWAIADGILYLLQVRPITTLQRPLRRPAAQDNGELRIWDNSNIGESYSGITTPLTFSFARKAYEEVYREFCRLLRVPARTLDRNDQVFRNMIGLVRGRIYYNLLNWYRTLAMLPGFAFNSRFMEQMMGVKEPLPVEVSRELAGASRRERLLDGIGLCRSAASLIANHFTIQTRIRRFLKRLEAALSPGNGLNSAAPNLSEQNLSEQNLSELSLDELAKHYRNVEGKLLRHWDAPLVNDFLAMICSGLLRKCLTKWCNDADGDLQNALVGGESNIISTDPAARIRKLAEEASTHPDFAPLLRSGTWEQISNALSELPEFQRQFESYLHKFGDRCLNELKLESATLREEPLILARAVGLMTARINQSRDNVSSNNSIELRRTAEHRLAGLLDRHPIRRMIVNRLLKNTRARVRDRENLRFERTRVFGHARRIFVNFGRRFREMELIDNDRDIFYLEAEEILGYVEGTGTCSDFRALSNARQREFESYRHLPEPPSRFETRGPISSNTIWPTSSETPTSDLKLDDLQTRKGIGCSPGIIRGRVRVVFNPQDHHLQAGEILVAERTDPGWILLFPAASGLIVERGSLLSHSAIVARELGIPTVLSIPDATRWLHDGDLIELNGGNGEIRRIESAAEADQLAK